MTKHQQDAHDTIKMDLESLENRVMLSTVEIFAAGSMGDENIEVTVGDQTVATFTDLGSGADAGQFKSLKFQPNQSIAGQDLRIKFVNDLYDPANGIDRNVRVDKIVIDGVTVEAESSAVFSDGTWKS